MNYKQIIFNIIGFIFLSLSLCVLIVKQPSGDYVLFGNALLIAIFGLITLMFGGNKNETTV